MRLLGRGRELETIEQLLRNARDGRSGTLVLRGEAGVGKTALLDHAVEAAVGTSVTRAGGIESEMELAFAGLHQLCLPFLDRLQRLPAPQREALATAFGLTAGHAPDRFFIGLAVLGLFSDVAEDRPLLCVMDDVQWLDRASTQVLAFVARRLLAESVVMIFAAREPADELRGLPELALSGLGDADASELLESVTGRPVDRRVGRRIIAETRGNPLALLELPLGLSSAELAGGFSLPGAISLDRRMEESFRRRLETLPDRTRLLALVASAEPLGDAALVWRAAASLGVDLATEPLAETGGLLEVGDGVRFRHPLVRSAVYRSATADERMRAHAALADATDSAIDPDRRVWHRAHAVAAADEEIASELERSADRARARGALLAAAAFLGRAVQLTPEPQRRAERTLAAAQAEYLAGTLESASRLLETVSTEMLDAVGQAQLVLLRAQIAYARHEVADTSELMLRAAQQLGPLAPGLARESYRDAFYVAISAGRLARGDAMKAVARAVRSALPASEEDDGRDLLLDGLATLILDGYPASVPALRRGVAAFREQELAAGDTVQWLQLAAGRIAPALWDDESYEILSGRVVQYARDAGALTLLVRGFRTRVTNQIFAGQTGAAESTIEEARTLNEAMATQPGHISSELILWAWKGQEAEFLQQAEACRSDVIRRGEGQVLTSIEWTTALLYNSLSRYEEALVAAEEGSRHQEEPAMADWAGVELIEAAARTGMPERAGPILARLSETTQASGTDWALGMYAYTQALMSHGDVAESLYRDAIDRLSRSRARAYLARAHLVYGEWLRREGRRLEARERLREAHDQFTRFGMEAFAERAGRELAATGQRLHKPRLSARDDLTPQERQIAELARDGLSNPEIGARLFLSRRTVEWHLRHAFAKLGIRSRRELADVLTGS